MIFAFGTAVYSAFLFNQAKGRDLWQSPVLPLHLIAHATSAGAATLGLAAAVSPSLVALGPTMSRVLAGSLAVSLLALGAEFFSRHQTADAEAAAKMIVSGKFRLRFWVGVFFACHLVPIVLLASGSFGLAAVLALAGIAIFEDTFVEAGQSVPLACWRSSKTDDDRTVDAAGAAHRLSPTRQVGRLGRVRREVVARACGAALHNCSHDLFQL